jgi:autotransporter-associated beta strand protein
VIKGGSIILGDGVTPGAGSIFGNVTFTNSMVSDTYRSLVLNRPDNFTFSGNIIGGVTNPPALANAGQVVQNGTNVTTLTGNNTYLGGTVVSNGVLQVGNGGTSGSIGTGDATVWSTLVFNRADNATFTGGITGTGAMVQAGAGILMLTGVNTCTGPLIASNGTLVATSVGGDLDVSGGTITPTGVGSVGTLNVVGAMNISAGTVLVSLNEALSPSNSVFSVTGGITNTGGKLKLVNFGPTLTVGDKFAIFNQAVTGGAAMTIVSPGGYTFTNNLALDGSVTVTSASPPGLETITATRSGANLNLSWPAPWTGMRLQSQTNTLRQGLRGTWFFIPGTDLSNNYTTGLMTQSNMCVFYRLVP